MPIGHFAPVVPQNNWTHPVAPHFVIGSAGGAVSTGGASLAVYTTLPAAICGDGAIEAGEACDDGNTNSGDGCAADCSAIEPNYVCPLPGQPCVPTMVCGDKKITGTEPVMTVTPYQVTVARTAASWSPVGSVRSWVRRAVPLNAAMG